MFVDGSSLAALLGVSWAAALFGTAGVYRERIPRWWATSLRVAGLLLGVGVLAVQVRDGWLAGADLRITEWIVQQRNPIGDEFFLAVSAVLGPVEISLLTAVVAGLMAIRYRSMVCGLIIVSTVGGASAMCWLLKMLVARARPPLVFQQTIESSYSFPSGHVTAATALLGITASVLGLHAGMMVKRTSAALAMLIAGTVALSRFYLGVHWFSDIVAGALVAVAAVLLGGCAMQSASGRWTADDSSGGRSARHMALT